MKFLHCMKAPNYLESAIQTGLMMTQHNISFKISNDQADYVDLINAIMPFIERQLAILGTNWDALSKNKQRVISAGIGNMQFLVPMVCFTEVPEGRQIAEHGRTFGKYALCLKRGWIEAYGGDRIAYVGDGSKFSRLFANVIGTARAGQLISNPQTGDIVFHNDINALIIDLLCFIEPRMHQTEHEEFEWRIAGNHGLLGGDNDDGKKLPFSISDIETLFVEDQSEIAYFKALLQSKASAEGWMAPLPLVAEYPA